MPSKESQPGVTKNVITQARDLISIWKRTRDGMIEAEKNLNVLKSQHAEAEDELTLIVSSLVSQRLNIDNQTLWVERLLPKKRTQTLTQKDIFSAFIEKLAGIVEDSKTFVLGLEDELRKNQPVKIIEPEKPYKLHGMESVEDEAIPIEEALFGRVRKYWDVVYRKIYNVVDLLNSYMSKTQAALEEINRMRIDLDDYLNGESEDETR